MLNVKVDKGDPTDLYEQVAGTESETPPGPLSAAISVSSYRR